MSIILNLLAENMYSNLIHRVKLFVKKENQFSISTLFDLRFLFAVVFFISLSAVGQILPDSIVITKNIYFNNNNIENIHRSDRYSILLTGNNYFLDGEKIAL